MTHLLTVAAWITATNGDHLKDDAREIARLADGGWISIQASRYHRCEPRLDNARRYRSIEIGVMGVEQGPADAAQLLRVYLHAEGSSAVYAAVPIDVAELYVRTRGGIVSELPPRR